MKQIIWIQSHCKLCFKDNYLVIEKEDSKEQIYLGYISTIIVDTLEVSITAYLINELMKNDINIIFVNEKHSPSYRINEIYRTYNQTERLNNQLNWTSNKKDKCLDKIVKNKIAMQEELIERLFNEKKAYSNYIKKVKKGDIYNCEAFVSRKYFLKLFGNKFVRHNEDDINTDNF